MDRERDTSFGYPRQKPETTMWQTEDLDPCPTPAEVIGQIGRIILICLILGLLARLLVAVVGVQ